MHGRERALELLTNVDSVSGVAGKLELTDEQIEYGYYCVSPPPQSLKEEYNGIHENRQFYKAHELPSPVDETNIHYACSYKDQGAYKKSSCS